MAYGKGGSPNTPTPDWDKDWPKPGTKPRPQDRPNIPTKLAKMKKRTNNNVNEA